MVPEKCLPPNGANIEDGRRRISDILVLAFIAAVEIAGVITLVITTDNKSGELIAEKDVSLFMSDGKASSTERVIHNRPSPSAVELIRAQRPSYFSDNAASLMRLREDYSRICRQFANGYPEPAQEACASALGDDALYEDIYDCASAIGSGCREDGE